MTKPLGLAVSGGSDSMALLELAADWAKHHERPFLTFTVDHGLRPEARDEAAFVAMRCAELQIDHKTLRWATPRKSQAAARRARYTLMSDAAREFGAGTLLLGHTLDDVMETLLIRRRRDVRDPSVAGPMMCAPCPIWPEGRGITLLRPLLGLRRHKLRGWLKGHGLSWVEDPSNQDMHYERARVRAFLKRHPRLSEILAKGAVQRLEERAAYDRKLAAGLGDRDSISIGETGLITYQDIAPSPHILAILIRIASGQDHSPRREAVRELLADLQVSGQRRTLGGAWLQRTKTGFQIGRDPGQVAASPENSLWDGRYVCDERADLNHTALPFLVREAAPPGPHWREIMSERLTHVARCMACSLDWDQDLE